MEFNLLEVFNTMDYSKFKQDVSNLISLSVTPNKRSGSLNARAVFNDGRTLYKTVTSTGVEISKAVLLPAINSISERNKVILDLVKKQKMTQEQVAAILNISQSTVSKIINKWDFYINIVNWDWYAIGVMKIIYLKSIQIVVFLKKMFVVDNKKWTIFRK